MKKQLIALALSTALLTGSAAAIAPEEAFPAVNTYPGFADVAGSAWYAATVQTLSLIHIFPGEQPPGRRQREDSRRLAALYGRQGSADAQAVSRSPTY